MPASRNSSARGPRDARVTSAARTASCSGSRRSGRSAPSRAEATSTSPGLRIVTFAIQVPSATSSIRSGEASGRMLTMAPIKPFTPSPAISRFELARDSRSACTTAPSSAARMVPASSTMAIASSASGPRRSAPTPPMARCPCGERPRKASRASSAARRTRIPAAASSPRFTCSILACTSDSSVALLSACVDRPAAAFPAVTASKLNPSCRSLEAATFGAAFATGAADPRSAAPAAAALTAALAATRSSPASGGSRCASARNSRSRKRASAASRSYTPISPPVAGRVSGASRSIVISPWPANAASRFAASDSRMRTGSTSSKRA